MPTKPRAIFLKQSGELLEKEGSIGHWGATLEVADKIAEAYHYSTELNLYGLTIVIGAGNLARGDSLRSQGLANKYADAIGRWGTFGNAMVLTGALETHGVPVKTLIAPGMSYDDPKFSFENYSPQKVAQAHAQGKIVVIGGGCGEDNVTTDYAIAFYANDYRRTFNGEIMVLKGTKYDGVYTMDPKQDKKARKYPSISASAMLKDYQRFKVVDRKSLDQLIAGNLSMLIYSEPLHSLREVLASSKSGIGTIVTPD